MSTTKATDAAAAATAAAEQALLLVFIGIAISIGLLLLTTKGSRTYHHPPAPTTTPAPIKPKAQPLTVSEITTTKAVKVPPRRWIVSESKAFTVRDLGHGVHLSSNKRYTQSRATVSRLLKEQRHHTETIRVVAALSDESLADLVTMAIIESGLGESNICNASGYCGLYQFGLPAWQNHGEGARLNPKNSTLAAISLKRENERMLSSNGVVPVSAHVYLAHQQGASGLKDELIAMSGGKLTLRKSRRLAIAICNNIPKSLRGKVCVATKNSKGRTFWRKKKSVSLRDLVTVHYAVWVQEFAGIKNQVKRHLK